MPADRKTRPNLTACCVLWSALGLSACGTTKPVSVPLNPATAPAPPTQTTPAPSTPAAPEVSAKPAPIHPVPEPTRPAAAIAVDAEPLAALLAYAERVRVLSAAELSADIVSQGEPGPSALRQMRLAIALMHTQLPVDTARALGLLQRVAYHTAPESAEFKPLARLLSARLVAQRRLEDTVERQNQQLRDSQRRIEQLSERLEAMRAIERSLTTRPKARPVPTP
ncbi:MAG: hypothetical protein U1D25_15080 [Hydrogenophaga sp.]|uniref:hypothetical protein n=1 Tax=Hydrogenophaga sp. TaxID=1904254 RepID=UPI00275AEBB8|nr:hypothetical protein [Hydrogenophaga sp.]MDP2419356.1 hypothetical protein [Hydrogenophaga sp.]MDZ4189412.1 hypothetical protein [Hydrogenophaga sp.]